MGGGGRGGATEKMCLYRVAKRCARGVQNKRGQCEVATNVKYVAVQIGGRSSSTRNQLLSQQQRKTGERRGGNKILVS